MPNPPKKPPVVAISGSFTRDVITQADLVQAAELQAAVWLAEKTTREFVQEIEKAIVHGATVEEGELIFDRDLQMARRKQSGKLTLVDLTPEQRLQIYEEEKRRIEARQRKEGSA